MSLKQVERTHVKEFPSSGLVLAYCRVVVKAQVLWHGTDDPCPGQMLLLTLDVTRLRLLLLLLLLLATRGRNEKSGCQPL